MHPFIEKIGSKRFIKLSKELYALDLINRARREIPGGVLTVYPRKKYNFVEIRADSETDYFDFLNFLIYLKQSK